MTSTIEAPAQVPWSAVPLSAEQQGLLYLHQLEPDSARYHVPVAFELVGELDVPALERALKALVRRHPLLAARTGADPSVLDADPERTIPLERKTFHAGSAQVVELLQKESLRPLDVENAGMTRAVLVTSTEDRHHLMLVVHHVVLDGEASGVLVADLWSLYTAERDGTVETVEPAVPAHAYADHVAARRGQKNDEELRAYWQNVLADGCGPVELPSDGPADKATADVVLEFDPDQTAAVNSFARKHRVGVFPVLLAAFQRTLAQYARQQRVAVAVPVSTRHDPGLDRAVGCFVNTVLVRSPENPGLDRAEYVRAVRTEVARAIDHSALPYPRIAELAPGVDFNCVFTYQSWFEPGGFGENVPGLRIRLVEQVHQPVVGDLTLELFADADRIRGRLRYAADKFAEPTAVSFARQLVGNACGEQITVHVDDTAMPFDEDDDIHWSLRRAAKENAERIALQEGDRSWTYAELDAETAKRAAGLRANGVNIGDTVGLWLPRSAGQVIAVLSVLRAGAVFVPLDPAHPDHRLDDIARRARLALVIREANDRPTPAGLPGVELSALDGAEIEDVPPRADQPAYVLFTSGSTGVPKGVVVGHRAFVNHLAWSKRYFDVTPDDAMAFSGTLSFDVTLHQLFVPLVCGARLVVVPEGEHRDADKMAATLNRHGVTLLHVVPALLRLLVDSPTFAENRSLRAVVSAGEALTNHLRRAFKDVHKARLYNAYGPTEATVYATVFDATDDNNARWAGQADVPIGEALDNIRCHVLDEQLRPVPDGAPGELCLAGVALADGYHGDPERTAEQFVGTDERLYRTGDLVRRLPEGGLSYLGRLDHQVKLNGFRVELGEVEAAMLAAPGVRDAVAIVRRHENGHSQLLGYVAPECDAEKTRAVVAQRLPAYMVPVHVVALPELPRLPSGKTDRKALPEPVVTTTPVAKTTSPKAGALELVRTVWTEVIGRAPADDEHFFEAGGDSILAMQLVSKLRRAGCTIDVRDLHRTPVLADLAATLKTPEVETTTGERFLAPIQSWFLDTVHTDRHHWNQSVRLELTRPIDPLLLGLALQAIVNAHPALSMRLAGRDIVDAPAFSTRRPKDVLDSVDHAGPESIVEVQESLDPEAGILLRARHLRDGDHESLLIAIHHLAVDGVSWRILLDDLESAVAALEQGELPRLPAEGQSYRSWLDGLPALAADAPAIAYWRAAARRRQTADTLVRLGSTGVEGDARRVELTLDEPATSTLLGRIPAALGMPVHDVLTGLVALALGRWRGCGSVTFDVETHGRQTATGDVSRTVGWFTALYPVTTTVDRTLAPAEHLRVIRAELAEVPDGGAGFAVCAGTSITELPAALISFNYLGQVDQLAGSFFRVGDGAVPGERSPRTERPHSVELYGLVRDGELRLGATFVPSAVDGVDEHGVTALLAQLRELAASLAVTASEPEEVPLSSQQCGILVDSLAHRGTGRYVEQMGWVWRGPLDAERFAAAWRQTVRRHAALRSSFTWDGRPRLLVHDHVTPEVLVVNDKSWDQLLADDRRRGFDLDQPPLLRVAVLDEGSGSYRVLLSFHHALLDGWGMALVLENFYLAYLGHPRPIDAGEPDARSHARWLAGQDTTDAEAFWSSKLNGVELSTQPGILADTTGETGIGRVEMRHDASELSDLLRIIARRGATESTLLQTLWAILLHRFGGGGDVVSFGVTLSGRGIALPGAERIPGLLMTTLPLAVPIRDEDTVIDLVDRVREAALDMSTFEWVSTGQVHDWSGRRGTTPLFESLLVVENYPSTLGEVGRLLGEAGITVEQPNVIGAQTAYPCTLLTHRDGDELVLTIVHDKAQVGTAAAERITELWQHALANLSLTTPVVELLGEVELPRFSRPQPIEVAAVITEWPDDEIVDVVREVWRHVLGVPTVAPTDHFFTSGGHSLLATRFLRELSERCGRTARLDDLLANPTAAAFALAFAVGADGPRSPLVPLCPGLDPVLYLIHPPGGQVACYAEFARHYPGPEALYGIRDPRVDEPGQPRDLSVQDLARQYHDLLLPRMNGGPVVLGGFSGGGVIAQELACQLHESTGTRPLVLAIDSAAPTGEVSDSGAEGSFLRQLVEHDRSQAVTGKNIESGADYLDELAAVSEWMSGTGQADPYQLLAGTLAAVERHRPRSYDGPIAVLRAAETDFGAGEEFGAADMYYRTPGLGWEDHCAEVSAQVVAGNHVTLMTGDNVRRLAHTVADLVRRQHKRGDGVDA